MKQEIKVKFTDFWPGFNPTSNVIYNLLSQEYQIEISDDPDFVIFSVEGFEHLKFNCVRIFYTGENQTPDFNICDYALGFHHINFEDRYFRLPLYFLYDNCFIKAMKKHKFTRNELGEKTRFCNFVYSNKNAHPGREEFFYKLSEYKQVDSGGRYLNNIGSSLHDKFPFQLESKFTIAFENSSTNGYTTEKILQAFSAKTIPIYWGDPLIHQEFNPKSFINCHDYDSFDDVIEKVKELDQNDEMYMAVVREPIAAEAINPLDKLTADFHAFVDPIFGNLAYDKKYKRNMFYWGLKYESKLKQLIRVSAPAAPESLIKKIKRKLFS
jgi:hypothetical protein